MKALSTTKHGQIMPECSTMVTLTAPQSLTVYCPQTPVAFTSLVPACIGRILSWIPPMELFPLPVFSRSGMWWKQHILDNATECLTAMVSWGITLWKKKNMTLFCYPIIFLPGHHPALLMLGKKQLSPVTCGHFAAPDTTPWLNMFYWPEPVK